MSGRQRVLAMYQRYIRKVGRDSLEHLRSEPAALLQARVRAPSLAQVGLLERDVALQRMLSARHASQRTERHRLRFGTVSQTWPRKFVLHFPEWSEKPAEA